MSVRSSSARSSSAAPAPSLLRAAPRTPLEAARCRPLSGEPSSAYPLPLGARKGQARGLRSLSLQGSPGRRSLSRPGPARPPPRGPPARPLRAHRGGGPCGSSPRSPSRAAGPAEGPPAELTCLPVCDPMISEARAWDAGQKEIVQFIVETRHCFSL